LHGLFDDDDFRHHFIAAVRRMCHLSPAESLRSYRLERRRRLDELAAALCTALDIAQIERWLEA
jgi:adenosylcobyric acid synthase